MSCLRAKQAVPICLGPVGVFKLEQNQSNNCSSVHQIYQRRKTHTEFYELSQVLDVRVAGQRQGFFTSKSRKRLGRFVCFVGWRR